MMMITMFSPEMLRYAMTFQLEKNLKDRNVEEEISLYLKSKQGKEVKKIYRSLKKITELFSISGTGVYCLVNRHNSNRTLFVLQVVDEDKTTYVELKDLLQGFFVLKNGSPVLLFDALREGVHMFIGSKGRRAGKKNISSRHIPSPERKPIMVVLEPIKFEEEEPCQQLKSQ